MKNKFFGLLKRILLLIFKFRLNINIVIILDELSVSQTIDNKENYK